MSEIGLKSCVPSNKFDRDAVQRAREVGFPGINPVLPDLLTWIQDVNWPVAEDVLDLLSSAGPEIVPHLREILRSQDGVWKLNIVYYLLPKLDRTLLGPLRPDLSRLATAPAQDDRDEEVDQVSRALLEDLGWA